MAAVDSEKALSYIPRKFIDASFGLELLIKARWKNVLEKQFKEQLINDLEKFDIIPFILNKTSSFEVLNLIPNEVYIYIINQIENKNKNMYEFVSNLSLNSMEYIFERYSIQNEAFWKYLKGKCFILEIIDVIPEKFIDIDDIVKFMYFCEFDDIDYCVKYKNEVEFWAKLMLDKKWYERIKRSWMIEADFEQEVYLYGIKNGMFSFQYISESVFENEVRKAALIKDISNLESVVNNIYEYYYIFTEDEEESEEYINSLRAGYRDVLSVVDKSYFTDEMLEKLRKIKVF